MKEDAMRKAEEAGATGGEISGRAVVVPHGA
jgi:hypothetical protein